jgi:prevent-host-death family protein
MQCVTAKELKNKTGEVLRRVRSGAKVAITNRGRRIAVIVPAAAAGADEREDSFNRDPWAEIEAALESTAPEHPDWRQAMRSARKRP